MEVLDLHPKAGASGGRHSDEALAMLKVEDGDGGEIHTFVGCADGGVFRGLTRLVVAGGRGSRVTRLVVSGGRGSRVTRLVVCGGRGRRVTRLVVAGGRGSRVIRFIFQ